MKQLVTFWSQYQLIGLHIQTKHFGSGFHIQFFGCRSTNSKQNPWWPLGVPPSSSSLLHLFDPFAVALGPDHRGARNGEHVLWFALLWLFLSMTLSFLWHFSFYDSFRPMTLFFLYDFFFSWLFLSITFSSYDLLLLWLSLSMILSFLWHFSFSDLLFPSTCSLQSFLTKLPLTTIIYVCKVVLLKHEL